MEKSFFRNFVAMLFAAVMLLRTPEKFHIKEGNLKDLILRSIFGTVGIALNFWAIDHIGLADSNVLNKMSPFFAMIMSVFILREKASRREWLMVLFAFVGAALVIKPTAGVASLPAFVGLLSGFGAGTAYTYVRKLGKQGERGPMIVFFFSAFSCLSAVPFMIFDYEPMSGIQLFTLLMTGVAAMGGQLSITAAYTYAPAKDISVFDYTQVIFASIWGLVLFGEIPDKVSICGYVLIIAMAVLRWLHTKQKYES
jgi:drug/metabolite transporter (DMT)-like permease